MKIGFFGTPMLASDCLKELVKKYEISFVTTSVDKECGRNQKIRFCEVKEFAIKNGIKVLQPSKLRDHDYIEEIKKYNVDIFVVVAYGKLIPAEVYNYPPLKTINLHPSLLPKYRGAAPIQWALINGEKETGITVQIINDNLDAGDIVVQKKFLLDDAMNAADFYKIVVERGPVLIDEAIQLLAGGNAALIQQDHSKATYCNKIDKDTAHIDWILTSSQIHNLVRGLNPKPVAWTTFRGKNIKIWKTSYFNDEIHANIEPGHIHIFNKKRLIVGTGNGFLEILSIQPETKKAMDGLAFINGYRINENDCFK